MAAMANPAPTLAEDAWLTLFSSDLPLKGLARLHEASNLSCRTPTWLVATDSAGQLVFR